jgi:hypothetical protein
MVNPFKNFNIIPIKECKLYDQYKSEKICLYATNYFINFKYNYNERTLNYLLNLIHIIETFNKKIELTNDVHEDPNNKILFILRVYIDENYIKPDSINKLLLIEQANNNNNIKNAIKKSNQNFEILFFVLRLLQTYITNVILSRNKKYDNIEIYSYNSETYKLHRTNKSDISGIYETCGTLMRFHGLLDQRIGYCAMRNCSDNISVLDLRMHKYWINNLYEQKYLIYDFSIPNLYQWSPQTYSILKSLYLFMHNELLSIEGKLSKTIKRIPAGLVSCNVYKHIDIYKEKLNKIFEWIESDISQLKKMCVYGIDEIILFELFDDINERKITINFKFPNKIDPFKNLIKEIKNELRGIQTAEDIPTCKKISEVYILYQAIETISSESFRNDLFANRLASSLYFLFNKTPIININHNNYIIDDFNICADNIIASYDLKNIACPIILYSSNNKIENNELKTSNDNTKYLLIEQGLNINLHNFIYNANCYLSSSRYYNLLKSILKFKVFYLFPESSEFKKININNEEINYGELLSSSVQKKEFNLVQYIDYIDDQVNNYLEFINSVYTSDNIQPIIMYPRIINLILGDKDIKQIYAHDLDSTIMIQSGGKLYINNNNTKKRNKKNTTTIRRKKKKNNIK